MSRHKKAPTAPTVEAHEAERPSTRKNVMANNSTAVSNVIPFDFRGLSVRTVTIEGDPWFVAADACKVLALTNTTTALLALDDDERSKFNLGRQGDVNIINESGLYTLILRCRDAVTKGSKPHAFRRWVTTEVLPTIRKHGHYVDSEGKMSTLIGQTIGTDGFHMLGAVVKGKVSRLPALVQRRATAKIWSQTHAAFGVRSAADIPADQLDSARNFIAAYVVTEGELLPKASPGPLHVPSSGPGARWLVSFDTKGHQQLDPVPKDAFVLTSREYLKGIAKDGDIPLSTEEMIELSMAVLQRVKARYRYGEILAAKTNAAG